MKMQKYFGAWVSLIALGLLVLLVIETISVSAAPVGPEVTFNSTSRMDDSTTGYTVQAQAGNVTMLLINDTRTTLRWQGYYGNITGRISLGDASGQLLYDWNLANPTGQIYASNTSAVTWTSIQCFNMTASGVQQQVNLTALESTLGIQPTDKDGVNETFNNTLPRSFRVGATTIGTTDGCSATYLYTNNGAQQTSFVETILTDNSTTGNVVYTALLEANAVGFTGATYDFEMLVGVNGDLAGATNYYFYVELS